MDNTMTYFRNPVFAALLLALAWPLVNAAPNAGSSPNAGEETVVLDITGLRNARGDVGCLLFNQADGYPEVHAKALREIHAAIDGSRATCEFKRLAPGTYAAIVFHDENLNGHLDKNFLGVPQEGFGASNNVRPRFSAPGFQEAGFAVKAGAASVLSIQMGY
jgi:uncharacterized protein (DUF2141 family)